MQSTSHAFKQNAHRALHDPMLQKAMGHVRSGFIDKRVQAAARLPEFDQLRDQAKAIKDHTLAHLDHYLERYEAKVLEMGGKVHWCATAEEAREAVLDLPLSDARTVTKGKLMLSRSLNEHPKLMASSRLRPTWRYIIQLATAATSRATVHVNKSRSS